ncbi:MAG: phage portal protein [Deltaproteobacteria bacterium RIFCSPLOWO2_02_FULL_44_10]|nr:MAG: phage portal protein [Deltaproteobacteria bacterium RIFCSPHIGHO2_02_FULL_44_16]OGQ45834.1 MAG: phage portal protein [Deltaproteobacteria bacterium RIFCSPLOWO2_02_FULL_44_10]
MSKPTTLDRMISYFNPKAGADRARYRLLEANLRSMEKRRYEAASNSRRTSGWIANDTSSNAEIGTALHRLRARSRDLVRNNPYANRAVQVISSNVVGAGIIPQPKNKRMDELWSAWGDTTLCDSLGQHNFYGIQALAMREIVESGEILIRRKILKPNTGSPLPLQLQVLEGDFINDTQDRLLDNGHFIHQGIEFDRSGLRVAYYLYVQHPGESPLLGTGLETIRVPASEILHIYRIDRAGQIRGVPWGTPTLLKLKDFDEYEDAQLIRQKIAACFAAFVTEPDPPSDHHPDKSGIDKNVEPGLIYELAPGKQITFGNPPTIGADYEPYATINLRAVATGFGVTYEALTQDYSKVNFSSGRMGHIEFHRNIDQWRWLMLIPGLCEEVWNWFVEAAELANLISAKRIKKATWTPPRREMIDPVKETEAQIKAIRGGLKTLSETIREQGNDPEKQFEEMKQDNELLDKYRLQLDSDARKMSANGMQLGQNGTQDQNGNVE